MEATVASGPFFEWAGVPSLGRLIALARALVRSTTMSPEERELRALLQRVAERIAEPILRAASCDEVKRWIERSLSDPEPYALSVRALGLVTVHELAEGKTESNPELVDVLGDHAASRLANGLRLGQTAMREWVRLFLSLDDEQRAEVSRVIEAMQSDPLAFVYDPNAPIPLREALLDMLRALPAALAIAHAATVGRRLDPWLALELATTVERGQKELLRIVASAPGSNVPDADLSRAERFDDAALQREREEAHRRVEEWANQAEASGHDVYVVGRE